MFVLYIEIVILCYVEIDVIQILLMKKYTEVYLIYRYFSGIMKFFGIIFVPEFINIQ